MQIVKNKSGNEKNKVFRFSFTVPSIARLVFPDFSISIDKATSNLQIAAINKKYKKLAKRFVILDHRRSSVVV